MNKYTIAKKLDINVKDIHDSQLKYYFMNDSKTYQPRNIKPMFSDIKSFQYLEPIKLLKEYYQNSKYNYYEDLYKRNLDTLTNQRLDKCSISEIDKDEIILQYIKTRPNTFIITVWSLAVDHFDKIIEYLESQGTVYYTKKINLNYNGIKNLMFWMYDEFSFRDRLDFIGKKLDYTNVSKNIDSFIGVIVFDNTNNLNIGGQASPFKKVLRNKVLELMNKVNDPNIRGNDVIHINDYFYQSVEYGQLLFNSNSLQLLRYQQIEKIINKKHSSSIIKLNTYKKILYDEFDLKELSRICLMGGSTLYVYGIRSLGDIDSVMNIGPKNSREKEIDDFVTTNLFNNRTSYIPFIDLGVEGSSHWKESWTESNNQLSKLSNIDSFQEIIQNPSHHMYFCGLKTYIIDIEIVRKLTRKSVAMRTKMKDYADFIMMYFFHRDILKYVRLDQNNKLVADKPFEISKINRDEIRIIYDYIKKNYLLEEANKFNIEMLNKIFL